MLNIKIPIERKLICQVHVMFKLSNTFTIQILFMDVMFL